jgi:hypothetical protein
MPRALHKLIGSTAIGVHFTYYKRLNYWGTAKILSFSYLGLYLVIVSQHAMPFTKKEEELL